MQSVATCAQLKIWQDMGSMQTAAVRMYRCVATYCLATDNRAMTSDDDDTATWNTNAAGGFRHTK